MYHRVAKGGAAARQLRDACVLEELESRALLSAAPAALVAPSALAATVKSPTSIQLNWTDNDSSAQGYYVLRSIDGGKTFPQLTKLTSGSASTYTDNSVASFHSYEYQIEAYKTGSTSAASNTVAATTPLAAPSSVTASMVSATSIQVRWKDNDAAAGGYYILRSSDGTNFSQVGQASSATATTYTDSTAGLLHTYDYEVQAYNGGSTSAVSNMAMATTGVAAPSSLTATTDGPRSIGLAWTDNDPSATGYWIYRSSDGTSFSALARVSSGSATSWVDTTSAPYESRYYEIQAFNSLATSATSNVAMACVSLVAPTGLTATETSPTCVQLHWQDNDTATTDYHVLRSTGSGYSQIADLKSASASSYTDTSAQPYQHYQYEVQAFYGQNLSGPSNVAAVTTSLIAPSGLTATTAKNGIHLSWADNCSQSSGYHVLRCTDGQSFLSIATVTPGSATSYTDNTALASQTYYYEIQAYNGTNASAVSNVVVADASLGTPSGLTATATGPSTVKLTWKDNDSTAAGYYVLRSTNGGAFTPLATVPGGSVNSYTDAQGWENRTYVYEVEAYKGSATSAPSSTATATTPLATPVGLTASDGIGGVTLTWMDTDQQITGYQILRSIDGKTYSLIAQIGSGSTASYCDDTVLAGHKYDYVVQSVFFNRNTSAASNVAAITPTGKIVIGLRYGDELVIDATGASDNVSISQSGSTLTIVADGQTYTQAAPAAGIFLYTRGGADKLNIAASVSALTTVETIDGASTTITSAGSDVLAWIDSTDVFSGTGTVERVSSFAGGVSKAVGASLANPPTPTGIYANYTQTSNVFMSLWGTGPVPDDVNQGAIGDCYFLSSLAAFAQVNPAKLQQSAVDMGDGTYDVRFYTNGVPVDVRVSNNFISGPYCMGSFLFAHPGANNAVWAAVMEKAFCYFTTGVNTYDSLLAGDMSETYSDLNVASNSFTIEPIGDSALYNVFATALNDHDAVTLCSSWPSELVSGHAYTLIRVYQDSNGVDQYVVRNPWGCSGVPLENSLGYATLTYDQFMASFVGATVQTS